MTTLATLQRSGRRVTPISGQGGRLTPRRRDSFRERGGVVYAAAGVNDKLGALLAGVDRSTFGKYRRGAMDTALSRLLEQVWEFEGAGVPFAELVQAELAGIRREARFASLDSPALWVLWLRAHLDEEASNGPFNVAQLHSLRDGKPHPRERRLGTAQASATVRILAIHDELRARGEFR